jgi:SAM-dependent methyltransferase
MASPRFLKDFIAFRASAKAKGTKVPALADIRPILSEATSETGFDTHYVYHTAWAARVLARTRPVHHIDIGSSLYFCAIASAFVKLTHYDYRPPRIDLPGLGVGAADLLDLSFETGSIASLSCMHVIEHVGLGRYGDRLDPAGDARAASELSRVLAPGGRLLFATPVGRPAIHFNAHRIYSHEAVLALFPGLELEEFALITDKRDEAGPTLLLDADPARVSRQRYGCGCYVFVKPDASKPAMSFVDGQHSRGS